MAAAGLHHVATMLEALPTELKVHAGLVLKIARFATWCQIMTIVAFVGSSIWLMLLWRRARRRQAGGAPLPPSKYSTGES